MADFYQRMQNTATGLLTKFKQGTIVYREITNTGDAWNPTQTETDYPVLGTASGVSAQYIDDTVLASDKEVTLAVFDVVPKTSGIVLIDGNVHQVVRVTPIPAAGTPAAYKVFCRA